jgi:hypothetical protein
MENIKDMAFICRRHLLEAVVTAKDKENDSAVRQICWKSSRTNTLLDTQGKTTKHAEHSSTAEDPRYDESTPFGRGYTPLIAILLGPRIIYLSFSPITRQSSQPCKRTNRKDLTVNS